MAEEALRILWEDETLAVVKKPRAINSEHTPDGNGLPDRLQQERSGSFFPIHRLDYGVGGALLCAKTKEAAAALSASLSEGRIKKEYLALSHGETPERGRFDDLLFYDRNAAKSFVVDRARKGVKAASLSFARERILESPYGPLSLVRVFPETGRTHQIRVQFANAGHPLLGDKKYGAKESAPLGLACMRLTFPHPVTKETIDVTLPPEDLRDFFPAL